MLTLIVAWGKCRGVVVQERGGTLFRQIFWSQNSAPANIGHRWNADTSVLANHVVLVMLTLDQFIFWPKLPPKRGIWHQKSPKKIFRGWHTRTPQREGATPSHTHPQHGYMPCVAAQAPPLLGPRSRKPFPQIKVYHYTYAWENDKPDWHAKFCQVVYMRQCAHTRVSLLWSQYINVNIFVIIMCPWSSVLWQAFCWRKKNFLCFPLVLC